MRKIYSLILALMVSITSFADITTVTYNGTSYTVAETQSVEVNATEQTAYEGLVADYSEQLSTLLTAIGLTSATMDNLVAVEPDGTAYAGNTNDGWHSSDGYVNGYGEETAKGVCVRPWGNGYTINGTISYIGCYDESWTADETHTCYYAFINDGKAALLQVTITFTVPELPNIYNYDLSSTTFDMKVEYTLGGSDEGVSASATLNGLYDALGTTAFDFDGNITNKVYARVASENWDGTYSWYGDIDNPASQSDGAWFGLYSDSDDEGNQFNAPMEKGTGATIYTQGFTLSNGTFTINATGQMLGTYTTLGEKTPVILYILNSSTAVQINVIPVIKAPLNANVTIGSSGYATFYDSQCAYTMPDDCKGYVFTEASGLESAYDAGDVVPADEPLVIYTTEPGTKTLTYTTSTESTYKSQNKNDLYGTDTQTALTADDDYYFYGLSLAKNHEADDNSSVGFYWMNATGAAFTNGAHKAYLKLAKSSNAKSGYAFNEDEVSAINAVESTLDMNAPVYNLTGQRVSPTTKGILIQNGKKFNNN